MEITSFATSTQRVQMLRAAVAGNDYFGISEMELEKKGPSYTIDTVEELISRGRKEVSWLIGADQLPRLPEWHRAAELVRLVKFVVVARPGYDLNFAALPREFRDLHHNVVQAPRVDISSTEIRNRVKLGKSIRYWVPEGVEQYIREHSLYKDATC